MTEKEYILATNLTKLRIGYRALADVFLSEEIDPDELKGILVKIDEWVDVLEGQIQRSISD